MRVQWVPLESTASSSGRGHLQPLPWFLAALRVGKVARKLSSGHMAAPLSVPMMPGSCNLIVINFPELMKKSLSAGFRRKEVIKRYCLASEMSQREKDKYCTIPLHGRTLDGQIHRDREWNRSYQGQGSGE